MRIAVFGLGYIGTVTAAGLAAQGHQVCGVDVDRLKVESIRAGVSPVVEPGLDDLVAEAVRSGHLTVTDDPAVALDRADLSLLCVGTPSTPQGGTDLTYLRRAVDDIRAATAAATRSERPSKVSGAALRRRYRSPVASPSTRAIPSLT